ncbi:hypothetical protein IWX88_000715 [Frigoribacterium sp. CG_9.8]|nr:hypothetical protein [Frigoribacterium sp. CG_9.8]
MGFLDRLLGREEEPRVRRAAPAAERSEDEIAVERYEYLLRTAPPETIEKVHTEAFSKLTPEQRDILFDKLTENTTSTERPADAEPATLAKAATRAELQQPGTLTRTLGGSALGGSALGGAGGPSLGGMFASSLLGSVAGFVIGSALVSAFMPMDFGNDGSSADASGADAGATDASGADGGGYDGGGFAGGDFGGGDFGGF